MFVTKTALSRRAILRGAGAAVALPLLDAMVPALTALVSSAAAPRRRLGVVYVPNGMSMLGGHWTPADEGRAFRLTPILEPLAPFRERLVAVSGLTNRVADPLPGEGAGDHSRGPACFLTGVHIRKTQGGDIQAGTSVDQIAAQVVGNETQLPSIEVGLDSVEFLGACDPGYSCAYRGTISWRNPTTPLPMENDPRAVFERLFGDGDRQARQARQRMDRSLLDALTEDAARLQRGLGAGDRAKLTQYLDAVRDAERRIQKAEEQGDRELPVDRRPSGGIPSEFEDHFRLMFDLVTLAYQADVTRIFTFMLAEEQSGHAYPESGVPDNHHGVSHHQYDPAKLESLAKINAYHMRMFASFVAKLDATPDGDGSLLDHVMLLYGAGISDSDKHAHDNLPILLVGGGAGTVAGGRHLRVPRDTPLANLHVTLLDKMGVPIDSVGDSTGPLSGLAGV